MTLTPSINMTLGNFLRADSWTDQNYSSEPHQNVFDSKKKFSTFFSFYKLLNEIQYQILIKQDFLELAYQVQ